MGENSVLNCRDCDQILDEGCFFCFNCGTANFNSTVIHEKTTANYDPLNKDFKPWREKCPLPKRNYKKNNYMNKIAWRPGGSKLPSKKLPKKKETKDKELAAQEDPEVPIIVVPSSSNLPEKMKKEEIIKEPFIEEEIDEFTETIDPIAVYEAFWLPCTPLIHMSLVSQKFGKSNQYYWLRVGLSFDLDESEQEEDAEEGSKEVSVEDSSELVVLQMLPNEVAQHVNLVPNDWVDLHAIDAREYYMGRHMHRILASMAYRVQLINPAREITQYYKVVLTEHSLESFAAYNENNSAQMITVKAVSLDDLNIKQTKHIPSNSVLHFGDWIAVTSGRVKVSRHPAIRNILAEIKVSINSAPLLRENLTTFQEITLASFEDSKLPVTFSLHISPRALTPCTQKQIPPCVLSFQIPTLRSLTPELFPKPDKFTPDSRVLMENILGEKESKEPVLKLVKALLRLVRVEYGEEIGGAFYSVVGTFSDPAYTSSLWP